LPNLRWFAQQRSRNDWISHQTKQAKPKGFA